jgi:hypothetical protein
LNIFLSFSYSGAEIGSRPESGHVWRRSRNICARIETSLRLGDIVIDDDLPAHKVAHVKELTKTRGATLKYLPSYSPDLNPIEHVFAKLKALLRQAAQQMVDKLCQAVGQIMGQFHAEERLNYFKNSGYVPD